MCCTKIVHWCNVCTCGCCSASPTHRTRRYTTVIAYMWLSSYRVSDCLLDLSCYISATAALAPLLPSTGRSAAQTRARCAQAMQLAQHATAPLRYLLARRASPPGPKWASLPQRPPRRNRQVHVALGLYAAVRPWNMARSQPLQQPYIVTCQYILHELLQLRCSPLAATVSLDPVQQWGWPNEGVLEDELPDGAGVVRGACGVQSLKRTQLAALRRLTNGEWRKLHAVHLAQPLEHGDVAAPSSSINE
jgi:hypothetical protein